MLSTFFKKAKLTFAVVAHYSNFSYNPNISLISNIGHTKKIDHLLTLHERFSNKFTSIHLAHAARKFIKLVKFHQASRALRLLPLISSENAQTFNKFLAAIRSVDLSTISSDEFIGFTIFLQKIGKYKDNLREGAAQISLIEKELRDKILKRLDEGILQQMSFQQSFSLLTALRGLLDAPLQQKILQFIHSQLQNNPYCTCFHFAMLSNEVQKGPPSKIRQEIQQICYIETMKQLEIVQKYLHPRALIQVFNAFYTKHPEDMSKMLPVISDKLQEYSDDVTIHATFFQNSLHQFESHLKQIANHQQIIQSLKKRLSLLRQWHTLKVDVKQRREEYKQSSSSFFNKRKDL